MTGHNARSVPSTGGELPASTDLQATSRLEEALQQVSLQAARILGADRCLIFMPSPGGGEYLTVHSSSTDDHEYRDAKLGRGGSAVGLAFERQRVVTVQDVPEAMRLWEHGNAELRVEDRGDHLRVLGFAAEQPEQPENLQLSWANSSSLLAAPMLSRGKAYGVLALGYGEQRSFSHQDLEIATGYANQAALAIENTDLYARAEERAKELESLLHVSRAVASTLELEKLVRLILQQLREVVEYSAASLILLESEELVVYDLVEVTEAGIQGQPAGIRFHIPSSINSWKASSPHHSSLDYPCVQVAASPSFWSRLTEDDAVLIPDVFHSMDDLAVDYRENMGEHIHSSSLEAVRSWMAVPLTLKDKLLGYVGMASAERSYFNAKHARLARAFADQAAIAVENARLYDHGQRLAVLNERQRVARDLHDSVAQALYGVALGAKTAKKFLPNDPEAAVEPIDYAISLAAAGLAEMRALIFDLHPESIRTDGLIKSIERHLQVLPARHGIEVQWSGSPEPQCPIEVKEAIYAIVREAIHNAVKHAETTTLTVSLTSSDGTISFSVRDFGNGFDPEVVVPGHMGLRSMTERAKRLGGELNIESAPGAGTCVSGSLPHL